jgi:hypothetical protein
LENGGYDFINKNSAIGRISLGRDIDGSLRWLAYFDDLGVGAINIYIDPYSGEVLEIDK